jgi:molybdate transport system permease protein
MGQPWVQESLLLSFKTSLVATLVCVLLGTPAAYVLARVEVVGRRLIDAILQLPLVLPPVVAGVGLLMAFGRRGLLGNALMLAGIEIPFTTAAVVLAQVFMGFPMHVQAARAGFQNVPKSVEEASRTLGAGSFATLLRVTVPLSWPALVSGAILCWGRAMGEFGATIMFAGNMRGTTRTMPLAILTAMQSDVEAAVVLAVMLLAFSAVMFVGARWALSGVAGVL